MDQKVLQGHKGGAGKQHTPVEEKNTLLSKSYAKVLLAIGEGEFAGNPTAENIFLDGTPLQSAGGLQNFGGVKWEYRSGRSDQSYITGVPDVSNEFAVNLALTDQTPWTRLITTQGLDAIRVTLAFPAVFEQKDNGDIVGYNIEYAIDLSTNGGAYVEQGKWSTNSQKTTVEYNRTHRINLTKPGTSWTIRIRRLTPNKNNGKFGDIMSVKSIAEVIDAKLRYPNTALLFVEFDAETFGGSSIPKISVKTKGRMVQVPSNYSPETRQYTGVWNGTFKWAWTNNPAWVFYDLVTNERFGLGARITPDMVDKWTLYQVAQYCDVLVPDGKGGTEPRYTCNIYIQSRKEAWQVLRDVVAIFNGMLHWSGTQIVATADMPVAVNTLRTYSRSNVVDGKFTYGSTSEKTIATTALVSFDDPDNHFETAVEAVNDLTLVQRYKTWNQAEIAAIGVTSRGQAQRKGKYQMLTNSINRMVTFKLGLNGYLPRPGEVVGIADQVLAGSSFSGRISAATLKTVTCDRVPNCVAGDILYVNKADGTSGEGRTIQSVNGKVITVTANYSAIPTAELGWYVEKTTLKSQLYRITKVVWAENDAKFEVTGVQYEDSKYAAIDTGARLESRPITSIPAGGQDAPTGLVLSTFTFIEQTLAVTTLSVKWNPAKGAMNYEAQWRKDGGDWNNVGNTASTGFEVRGIYSGAYQARVRAINAIGTRSVWTESANTQLNGKEGLPPATASFSTASEIFGIRLSWTFPTGAEDTAYIQIQQATSQTGANVTELTMVAYPATSYVKTNMLGGVSAYFRARLIDRTGNQGPWSAWTYGISEYGTDKILESITGEIGRTELGQELLGELNTTATTLNQVKTDVGTIQTDVAKTKSDITALDTKVKSDVSAINTQITNVKNDLTNQVGSLNTQITNTKNDLNSQITGVKGDVTALQTSVNNSVTSLNQSVTTLTNRANAVDTTVAGLRTDLDAAVKAAEYDATKTYAVGDIVRKGQRLYQALIAVPVNKTPPNVTYWKDVGTILQEAGATAAQVSTNTTTITNQGNTLTSHTSQLTGLTTRITNAETNITGTSNALSNLSSTVTQQGNTLTSQGQSITNVQATVDGIAGSGTNLLEDTYSWLTSTTLPAVAKTTALTTAAVAVAEADSKFGYQIGNSTASSQFLMLSPTNNAAGYNIRIEPGTYLVSFYIKGNNAGQVIVSLYDGTHRYTSLGNFTTARTRVTLPVTVTDSARTAVTIYPNRTNVAGMEVIIDSVMVEKRIGATNTASPFVAGTSAISVTNAASATSALTARVTTAEGTITSQGTSLTNLTNRVTTAEGTLTSQGTAISGLTNTVTAQGGSITSQGTAITNLSTTVGAISGTGSNLLPAEYCTFSNTAPSMVVGGGITAVVEADAGTFAGYALRFQKDSGTATVYLSPSTVIGSANMQMKQKKYIVSMYVRAGTDGHQLRAGFRAIQTDGTVVFHYPSNMTVTTSWARYTTIIDMTASPAEKMILCIDPKSGSGAYGVPVWVDKIMVEEQVATGTTPSTFVIGNSAGQVAAQGNAIQSLTNRVTSAEGNITSQGQAITSLTNTVSNKADSSALQALTSRVTTAEGNVTSQGESITQLDNKLTGSLDNSPTKVYQSVFGAMATDKWVSNASTSTATAVYGTEAGSTNDGVMVLSGGAGNGHWWGESTRRIRFDPTRVYKLSARVKQVSVSLASPSTYLGLNCFAEDGVTRINNSGANSVSSSHYLLMNNVINPTGQWVEVSVHIKGHTSPTENGGAGAGTAADPKRLKAGTAWFSPMVIANYNSKGGVAVLDYYTVEDVTEQVQIDANSSATSALTSRVSNAEGVATAQGQSITNLQTSLGNTSQDDVLLNPNWDPAGILKTENGSLYQMDYANATDSGVPANPPAGRLLWRLKKATDNNWGGVVLTSTNKIGNDYQIFTRANAGDVINISCHMFCENAVTNAGKLCITPVDSAGNTISVGNVRVLGYVAATGGWQALSTQYTLPAGSAGFRVYLATEAVSPVGFKMWLGNLRVAIQSAGEAANAAATTALTATVTQQGNTITSQGSALTSLTNTVANKADSSAVTALTSRVTAVEGTTTSQGQSITNLTNSVNAIGGNGTNLMPSEYSVFSANVPPIGAINAGLTFTTVVDAACQNGYALKFTSSLATNSLACYLHVSNATADGWNMSYDNAKYIISFYAKTNVAGRQIRAYLRALNSSDVAVNAVSALITLTTSWVRYSAVMDLTNASTFSGNRMAFALMPNNSGVSGTEVYFDRFMVEKQVGASSEPSTYNGGSSYTQAAAQGTALQALTNRVTAAEGTITSQSSSITSLTNRISTAEGNITSQGSAISGLTSTVTTQGNTITSQGNSLTALQSSLSQSPDNLVLKGTFEDGDIGPWTNDPTVVGITAHSAYGKAIQFYANSFCGTTRNIITAPGEVFDTSADIWNNYFTAGQWARLQMQFFDKNSANIGYYTGAQCVAGTNGFQTYTGSITAPAGSVSARIVIRHETTDNVGRSLWCNIMIRRRTAADQANADATTALTTTVTNQGNTITSQGNSITSLTNTVSNKADASALTALTNRVTAAEGNITTASSNITQLDNALGDAGAENLLYNPTFTRTSATNANWPEGWQLEGTAGLNPSLVTSWMNSGERAQRVAITGITSSTPYMSLLTTSTTRAKVAGGQTFTSSIYVRRMAEAGLMNMRLYFQFLNAAGTLLSTPSSSLTPITVDGSRITLTATAPADATQANIYYRVYGTTATATNGTIEFARPQVEAGSKASGWHDNGQGLASDIAATSSALSSLTSTVTQQGTTVTSQGQSITSLTNSFNGINAAVNLMPAEFSVFGATAPTQHKQANVTITTEANTSAYGNYALRVVSTVSQSNYFYLTASSTDCPLKLKPTKNYIMSFWVQGDAARTSQLRLRYKNAAGSFVEVAVATVPVTTTWTRVSAVITTPAAVAGDAQILVFQNATAGTSSHIYDGFMLEEQIGTGTEPSTFSVGNSARQVEAQSTALSSLTNRVTNAEGTITSQGTSITSLQSSVGSVATDNLVNDPTFSAGHGTNQSAVTVVARSDAGVPDGSPSARVLKWALATGASNLYMGFIVTPNVKAPETGVTHNMVVAAGDTYDFEMYAYTSASRQVGIWIQMYDAAGTSITHDWVAASGDGVRLTSTAATWTKLTGTRVIPAGVIRIAMCFRVSAGNASDVFVSSPVIRKRAAQDSAQATALSALDTRVTSAEGTITSQGTSITSLTNTVANKADSSALAALTSRVTTAEGNITSQGSSVTTLQNQVGGISGSGNNLLRDEYSWLTSVALPTTNGSATTTVGVAVSGSASGFGYKMTSTSTSTGCYLMLCPTNNVAGFNMPIEAGTYIVSFYASTPTTASVRMRLYSTTTSAYSVAQTVTSTRTRYSHTVTIGAPSTMAVLFYYNMSGVSGQEVTVDSVMVEKQTGPGTTASPFVAGPSASAVSAQATALTALTNRVTSTEGALTSASSSITSLTNSLNGIGGTGTNLLSDEYSWLTSTTLPPVVPSGLTATGVAVAGSDSGYGINLVATGSSNTYAALYLASATNTAATNMTLEPGNYIVSMYMRGTTAGQALFNLYDMTTSRQIAVNFTTTRTRQSGIITVPTRAKVSLLIYPNINGAASANLTVDSIMVEKQVVDGTTPSPFVAGPSARALTSLATTVTQQGSTITAQASSISSLTSTVGSHTSSISTLSSTQSSTNGKLNALYSVKLAVNSNGQYYGAGMGIGIENTPSGMQSQVLFVADRFAILNSVNGTATSPFVVQNGQTFIADAFINKATVTNAIIGSGIYSAYQTNWGGPVMTQDFNVGNVITRHPTRANTYSVFNQDGIQVVVDGVLRVRMGIW